MTLAIRQAPYLVDGTDYGVHPDEVRGNLGVIAIAGDSELPASLGEDPDPTDSNYTVVSFNPGTQDLGTARGRVRDRLRQLTTSGRRYEVVGVGFDFVWWDGTSIEASPGVTNGTEVVYDTSNCNGNGRWIRGTNGNQECVIAPGILYHELGHAWQTDPLHPESVAIEIENDLREAMGQVPRSTTQTESSCGCPDTGCCIVASVVTGSPYSEPVQALRRLRDYVLRSTELGSRFFDELSREYYQFSIPISRTLLLNPESQSQVELWLVRPLVRSVELLEQYTRHPEDVSRLGEMLLADSRSEFIFGPEQHDEWKMALIFLELVTQGHPVPEETPGLGSGMVHIWDILAAWLPESDHVRWAIPDLLTIYVQARTDFQTGADPSNVGIWLQQKFDLWLGELPLKEILVGLTTEDLVRDLPSFSETIMTNLGARAIFGPRLIQELGVEPGTKLKQILYDEGYLA
jgi:hypothetical protein